MVDASNQYHTGDELRGQRRKDQPAGVPPRPRMDTHTQLCTVVGCVPSLQGVLANRNESSFSVDGGTIVAVTSFLVLVALVVLP